MKSLTSRSENYSKWYNEIIIKSGLAEMSDVRGCMIIKPYGFSIWEKIQNILNKMFKDTGHENAYFPLLIPKYFLSKEGSHVNFAKECAIVTHYRLKKKNDQNEFIVDPDSKLEEEFIIRPTSETIIWRTYKNWIQSYRDLPILINQWSNVVRWEMRTRFFLRTSEFLWQEGHTAHSNKEEAIKESIKILKLYTNLVEKIIAIPVIKGVKTENEKFAGAEKTYCIEGIMQDGKALQIATSHFLGQNFSKAFDVKFMSKNGTREYVWGTSWGVSSRLMGALVMTHSDDKGLVLPPLLAPIQIVIIPIYKNDYQLSQINEFVYTFKKNFEKKRIRVKYDNRDTYTYGWKFNEYQIKGVPIHIYIGLKEIENNTIEIFRRDNCKKQIFNKNESLKIIPMILKEMQKNLFNKAKKNFNNFLTEVDNYDLFKKILKEKGGFILAHWDGTSETEKKIKSETKATIRCIPLNNDIITGKCIYSGKYSNKKVLFAKSY